MKDGITYLNGYDDDYAADEVKTFDEWNKLGYIIKKGENNVGKINGGYLFKRSQVVKMKKIIATLDGVNVGEINFSTLAIEKAGCFSNEESLVNLLHSNKVKFVPLDDSQKDKPITHLISDMETDNK
jgi:hypothetical protein